MEKEYKIIVVFRGDGSSDGFYKTWIREFDKIETAQIEIKDMADKGGWRVNRIYQGKRIKLKTAGK